jgi:broad-specificity NMP kinase
MGQKYLITGRAGSGKSAVNAEMQNRNLNSLDTDRIPGLARWEDLATGERTSVDPGGFVDYQKVGWNWNPSVLKGVLDARKTLFLCGSASNELEFHRLFDKVFVLTLDPEIQLQRLESRENSYGKDPDMQAEIIKEQAEFVDQAVQLGAIAVDNTRPLRSVVDEILELADE